MTDKNINYDLLCRKRDELAEARDIFGTDMLSSFDDAFDIEYAHNSTAIEGNTLSLIETKTILDDGLSVGGKDLREIYEVVNHKKAFDYVNKCIQEKKPLSEPIVKDMHAILVENIFTGGIYRNTDIQISGAQHEPPSPTDMYWQVKDFYADLSHKYADNAIERAAWAHAEFVRIHPFPDGNGRTSRMIMNYELMEAGFLPISIPKESRSEYFDALEEYALNGNIEPFANMVAQLESERLDKYLKSYEYAKDITSEADLVKDAVLAHVPDDYIHNTKTPMKKTVLIPDSESANGYAAIFVDASDISPTVEKDTKAPIPGSNTVNIGKTTDMLAYRVKQRDGSVVTIHRSAGSIAAKWDKSCAERLAEISGVSDLSFQDGYDAEFE